MSRDIPDDVDINAVNASATFGGIGCGTTFLGAGVDFAQAGVSTIDYDTSKVSPLVGIIYKMLFRVQ